MEAVPHRSAGDAAPYIPPGTKRRLHHAMQARALTDRLSPLARTPGRGEVSACPAPLRLAAAVAALLCLAPNAGAQNGPSEDYDEPTHHALQLTLPTANDALYTGDSPSFYQYTDRRKRPGVAMPWEGGKYGFVRNIRETSDGVIFTRFHEGMDIRPLERTSRGEPLDDVRTIDDGLVVHVNRTSRHSNYGMYVVVEHWWSGSPFYSLYAHLQAVHVEVGQDIWRGERVGTIGYTGVGLNRRRAHVHVEVNLLLNELFQPWYDDHFENDPNRHGIYNGLNLSGLDIAELFLRLRDNPSLTIREFLRSQEPFFRVIVPNEGKLDLLWRYAWLAPGSNAWSFVHGSEALSKPSWAVSFARSGLPLRVEGSDRRVTAPEVEVLEHTNLPYLYLTNRLLTGRDGVAALSKSGTRLLDLIRR